MDRYQRHRTLLSDTAWKRLKDTVIICAGAGGLGSFVLELCVRLGPVTLEVWDPGELDAPDLNRQVLYTAEDLGNKKSDAACRRLRSINPEASITCHSQKLTAESFGQAFGTPESHRPFVLFDCLDSFAARAEVELIRRQYECFVFHGGVEGWFGQVAIFPPGKTGYSDAFGEGWDTLPGARKPIIPPVVATIASYQVAAFIGWLENPVSSPALGRILLYDGKTVTTRSVTISKNDDKE